MRELSYIACCLLLTVLSAAPLAAQSPQLISINAAGTTSGNAPSRTAKISANGRFVVFTSQATNLVAQTNLNGNSSDVFVRDTVTNTTTLVSTNSAGTATGNATSTDPSISADGRFVAFDSAATDIVMSQGTITGRNVYVRDLQEGRTVFVRAVSAGATAGNASTVPSISADGRFVAFISSDRTLTSTPDTNSALDVFVHDLQTATTTLVSINSAGTASGGDISGSINRFDTFNSIAPGISDDGQFIVFLSRASDLTTLPDANDSTDAFVRDLIAGTTTLVSVNNSTTASGRLPFPDNGNNVLTSRIAISGDGSTAVFVSSAGDLVAGDANNTTDVFARDLRSNITELVSINVAGTASAGGTSSLALSNSVISSDGRFIAFASAGNDLVAPNLNQFTQSNVYLRDRTARSTMLVSADANNTGAGSSPSSEAVVGGDGRFVAFLSNATNLVTAEGDNSFNQNVFVRDSVANLTVQASVGRNGNPPNGASFLPTISLDNSLVAFESTATNFVGNDFNGTSDVFAFSVNQNPPLSVSITDAAIMEDSAGGAGLIFNVRLSGATTQTVTVNYATGNSTAQNATTATAEVDYQAANGTLTFNPGETTQTIIVPVLGDALDEADEILAVTLTAPINVRLSRRQATGLIVDDDPLPVVSINDASVAEGDSGTTEIVFNVNLSAASGREVTLGFNLLDGTARNSSDYFGITGSVRFVPGATTATIRVGIRGETLREGDESFFVDLSRPVNATLNNNQAVGIIIDEVTDSDVPRIQVSNTSTTEGSNLNFNVFLDAAVNQPVTVRYMTADGTATAASQDYEAASGVLTFAPGEISRNLAVRTIADTMIEDNETVFLNLTEATGAIIVNPQNVATITNNDFAGTLQFRFSNTNSVNESANAATVFVERIGGTSGTVGVTYATTDDTALDGQDYTATSGTLVFADGVTLASFTIPVIDDATLESGENLRIALSDPTGGASLGSFPILTLSITDNDIAAGNMLITEFRTRGTNGAEDEFVELYNNTDIDLTVGTNDGSQGWTLAALAENGSSASPRFTVPNGTIIRARSHYLGTGNPNTPGGYSLGSYPAGGANTNNFNAVGDRTYTTVIADNSGLALFRTANQANFNVSERLDAVGFSRLSGSIVGLYREGAGLSSAITGNTEHSYVRRFVAGRPQDTNDNATDFVLVSPTGAMFDNIQSVLGAPGPENSASPVNNLTTVRFSIANVTNTTPAGLRSRGRHFPSGKVAPGIVTLRGSFTNTGGRTITRLRFRVTEISTLGSTSSGSGGFADVRVLSSENRTVNENGTSVQLRGLTLEQPPQQPQGGGYNSSLTIDRTFPLSEIASGATVNVEFRLNVVRGGRLRFTVTAEVTP
ncbi:MAG: hypothetical protein MSG64_12575 [Pyrinomonadaceae bacterium MAG19_C2-C3]|nr:hypothetical protein [Pyrinomonadaceae bacterium MAG19_C2-C3]